VLNDVVINQVLVSFGSTEVTREVIRRVQEDGTCWCGGTVWKGRPRCESACLPGRQRMRMWNIVFGPSSALRVKAARFNPCKDKGPREISGN